jgi:transcriptional regulator with XRE-family HTH domain
MRHIFLPPGMRQSEFSEEIGFNRRLLSKYELGTSNISYATYIYMLRCLRLDNFVVDHILREAIYGLAQEGIYVYLNLDNVSLANTDTSTLEKPYVKESYLYVQEWFGLEYDFDLGNQFENLISIDNKELDVTIEKIFRQNEFYKFRQDYKKSSKEKYFKSLYEELNELKMNYANIYINNDFTHKKLSDDELWERDRILEKIREISEKLDKVKVRPIPRVISNRHPSGFSLNRERTFSNLSASDE